MMIDEKYKEEYRKMYNTLMCSDEKQSDVHWYFANKNWHMGCSDEVFCQNVKFDMSIVDVLKELQNVYKTLDVFRCSDSVSRYVSAVFPEFEIKNPVAHFDEMCKAGMYDSLSAEEYEHKMNDRGAMSFHPDVKNESEYVHLDVRDAYSDAMKAVSDLQSALKKIHDSALFVSMIYPFFTEQYLELDERDREQVDKIPEGKDWDDESSIDYGDWMQNVEVNEEQLQATHEQAQKQTGANRKIYAHGMLSREDLISSVSGINHKLDGAIIASYLDCKGAFNEDNCFDVKEDGDFTDGLYAPDGKTRYIAEYDGHCYVNDSFYRFLVSFNADWVFTKGRFSLAMSKRLNSRN